MLKKVISRFSVKFFCFIVPKIFVAEPSLLFFRNFPVAKKVYGQMEGEEVSNFPVDFFCLKLLKHFKGEPFSVSLFSCIERVYT